MVITVAAEAHPKSPCTDRATREPASQSGPSYRCPREISYPPLKPHLEHRIERHQQHNHHHHLPPTKCSPAPSAPACPASPPPHGRPSHAATTTRRTRYRQTSRARHRPSQTSARRAACRRLAPAASTRSCRRRLPWPRSCEWRRAPTAQISGRGARTLGERPCLGRGLSRLSWRIRWVLFFCRWAERWMRESLANAMCVCAAEADGGH